MEIEITFEAKKDLEYWRKSGNTKVLKRIKELLESIQETPCKGIGKPEALRFDLAGKWSRRINQNHRLIYTITDTIIYINSLKGHYD
ncbi:MAG TPA: Txe/YoeB family addiction module toxin [Hanamia sp.]|nr:Txe/YoeB family addiction module toxin [Hanamia sp.]